MPEETELRFEAAVSQLEQIVESLEVDHQFVEEALEGQTVGVKVRSVVQENDRVFRETEY